MLHKFILSVFFAFLLAKLALLNQTFQSDVSSDMLSSIILPIKNALASIGIENIKYIQVLNTGIMHVDLVANILITYTPIFFFIFILF